MEPRCKENREKELQKDRLAIWKNKYISLYRECSENKEQKPEAAEETLAQKEEEKKNGRMKRRKKLETLGKKFDTRQKENVLCRKIS